MKGHNVYFDVYIYYSYHPLLIWSNMQLQTFAVDMAPRLSAEHEILNAHEYKNIKKFSIFQTHVSLECYFSAQ